MSETSESDSEHNTSDEEVNITISITSCLVSLIIIVYILTSTLLHVFKLQEAFAKGLLKPGLNAVIETDNKKTKNYVVSNYFSARYLLEPT